MNEPIELGQILEISDDIKIVDNNGDYNVFLSFGNTDIPIGTITRNNLTFFEQSDKPVIITKIIYLGNYQFGVKQLSEPFDEFSRLSKDNQSHLIHELVYLLDNRDKDDEL